MATTTTESGRFRHEMLLYSGPDDFVQGVAPFVADGVERREPVFVVVEQPKSDALRAALGAKWASVECADMALVGRNPARILPAWQAFLDRHERRGPMRGIGEPVGPGRNAAELAECHRHEALLNVAFDTSAPWWLLCPYDEATLGPEVIADAQTTHPYVFQHGAHRPSPTAGTAAEHALPCSEPLTTPPPDATTIDVRDPAQLAFARGWASEIAQRQSFPPDRIEDLRLVVTELVANSLRHASAAARVAIWRDDPTGALVCEVRDDGAAPDPLAGRQRPAVDDVGGRGLWMVQQACDLLQQRRHANGNVARAHFSR